MLEKEIKVMLSEEEYALLSARLRADGEVVQTNHYYYSPECAAARISVRVREVDGRSLLQVKLPVKTEGSLAVREELERELSGVPSAIPAELLEEVCGVRDEAVRIGSLTTDRKLSYEIDGVELCLDRNDYLGITDCELEAEYTGDYPEAVDELLRELGIDAGRPCEGKYSRFCRRLSELGQEQ